MQTSPDIGELIAALAAASLEFEPIVKDKWNSHFGSHYADLASIREATDQALAKHGLRVLQAPDARGAVVTVTTRLAHKSGQWIEAPFSAEAKNGSAQAVGAATTFICRYAEVHILRLALGEDDDGNSTQGADNAPAQVTHSEQPRQTPQRRDAIAEPDVVFDFKTMEHELAAELKSRNVPEAKWEAIGRWLHGKDKLLLSKAIASA